MGMILLLTPLKSTHTFIHKKLSKCISRWTLPLLHIRPVPVRLLTEVHHVLLRVWKYIRTTVPHITVIVIVLIRITVLGLCLLIPTSDNTEINKPILMRFNHPIIVVICTGVEKSMLAKFVPSPLPNRHVLGDLALDILNRFHDVNTTPIMTLTRFFLPSRLFWHIHHTWFLNTRYLVFCIPFF